VFGLFAFAREGGMAIEQARTLAVNMLVAGEIVYLFNARRLNGPALSRDAIASAGPAALSVALVLLLQMPFTYWGPMQTLFGTAPLSLRAWGIIAAAALALFVVVEGEKALLRRFARRPR
jgi:magnesium-transporting ATPase (P-type)